MHKLNNKELLELLKTDVKSFNRYQVQFPEQEIDFRYGNLCGIDLAEVNLDGLDLTGCLVYLADLKRVNIEKVNIEHVTMIVKKEDLESVLKGVNYVR